MAESIALFEVCAWPTCERTQIFTHGLCRRCHQRARRAGTLDRYSAPPRTCIHCFGSFKTGSRGFNRYCSDECRVAYASAEVARTRAAARCGRVCPECEQPVPRNVRKDGQHCSVACQQAAWYRANEERLRATALAWSRANPESKRRSRDARRAREYGTACERVSFAEIWQRDRGICWLCCQSIDPTLSHPDPLSVSVDHIVPLVRGGEHVRSNLALAHLVCNLRKGTKLITREGGYRCLRFAPDGTAAT